MLGAFVGASGVVEYDNVRATLEEKLGRKKDLLEVNFKVLQQGFEIGQSAVNRESPA